MKRTNVLNKRGMLTDQDRLEPYEHNGRYCKFSTNLELSKPIKVRLFGNGKKITAANYSNDLAGFISQWNYFVFPDLNGFGGFSHVKYDIDFEIA